MSLHYQIKKVLYLHNLDIFKVVYIDMNPMLMLFEWQKKLLICEFFHVKYLQLSSVALPQWVRGVFQKTRNHVIDKLIESVGVVPSP